MPNWAPQPGRGLLNGEKRRIWFTVNPSYVKLISKNPLKIFRNYYYFSILYRTRLTPSLKILDQAPFPDSGHPILLLRLRVLLHFPWARVIAIVFGVDYKLNNKFVVGNQWAEAAAAAAAKDGRQATAGSRSGE